KIKPMNVDKASDIEEPLLPIALPAVRPVKVKVEAGSHALLGLACVAASALCFSFMTTFIKYETHMMSSMEAIFWRSSGAFVCNFLCVLYYRQNLYVVPAQRVMLSLRCLAGFGSITFAFYAISQMVLADASVIILTSPVMTFFFVCCACGACLLHEKVDPVSLLCAIVAFSALLFVVRPGFLFGYDPSTAVKDFSWVAVGSALLGALGQVFVFISVRQLKGVPALTIVHYFMLSSAILAFIWRAIVGCGVFTFLGQMFLTKGFQLEKAGIASVMRYLDVVFVFIWDWSILGEHINHWSIVGALVILTCAVVIAVRKMKGRT
ncbi:hypothetical protein BBJ28_00004539, partial [Nothophytophthora sp. Chile5]